MQGEFAFIPSDGLSKPRSAARSLIRRHCMQGKNKRAGSRRSQEDARRAAKKVSHPDQTHPGYVIWLSSSEGHRYYVDPWPSTELENEPSNNAKPFADHHITLSAINRLPQSLSGGPSLLQFAVELNTQSKQYMYEFLTFSSLKCVVYPIERCVGFKKDEWLAWLLEDEVFLSALLLGWSVYRDVLTKQIMSPTTSHHMKHTLASLKRKLSDREAALKDSMLFAVMLLSGVAHALGDVTAAGAHLSGLRSLIEHRGGLEALRQMRQLHFKVLCVDTSWSLSTGKIGHFSADSISWEPLFSGPASAMDSPDYSVTVDGLVDPKLATIFRDTQHLVALINANAAKNSQFTEGYFQNSFSSITGRLLSLDDRYDQSIDDFVRLALLALISTTFRIPGGKTSYEYLTSRYRTCCREFEYSDLESRALALWLLMMGAVSGMDFDHPWLLSKWRFCIDPNESWDEVRLQLQSVMWINFIHDEPGRKVMDQLNARVSGTLTG